MSGTWGADTSCAISLLIDAIGDQGAWYFALDACIAGGRYSRPRTPSSPVAGSIDGALGIERMDRACGDYPAELSHRHADRYRFDGDQMACSESMPQADVLGEEAPR